MTERAGHQRRPRRPLRVALAAALLVVAGIQSASLQARASAAPPRAHVVIALVGEVGVNPYQRDFAAPALTANPSRWLPGYPAGATPLHLHLHQPDLTKAIASDNATWNGIKANKLYYIPGTRFAGVVYLPSPLDRASNISFNSSNPTAVGQPAQPIIGDTFHGTGVASVAAGSRYGTCPDCDLVLVAADNPEDGLAWAARQPWIDIISNSWLGEFGTPTRATPSHPERAAQLASAANRAAAATGHAVVFASGNGATDLGPATHGTQHALTWDSPYAGPPWVLTVGASKPVTGQPTDWHNIPVDVIAQGEARPAADYQSTTGTMSFDGTSCSAPIASGVLGEALYRARTAVGDQQVGPRAGALLINPHSRAAATRRWDYTQLFDALRAVAHWHTLDPATLTQDPFLTPTTPAAYVYEGYGVVDRDVIATLTQILTGSAALPARPEMTQWQQTNQSVRTQLWGAAPQ